MGQQKLLRDMERVSNKFLEESGFSDPFTCLFNLHGSLKSCNKCRVVCDLKRKNKICIIEEFIFSETVKSLKQELEDLEIKITFSNKLLIKQTAMLLIRLLRAQRSERFGYLPEWENYNLDYARKERHLFDMDYIQKLEKRLIKHLKLLGVLPEQVVIREKIKIVEKLKKQLFKLEKNGQSYETDVVCEKETEL